MGFEAFYRGRRISRGAYRRQYSDSPQVNKGLIRPILPTVCFAFIPQCFSNCPKVQLLPLEAWWDYKVFVDTPPRVQRGLRVGFFFPEGAIRYIRCPKWVHTPPPPASC